MEQCIVHYPSLEGYTFQDISDNIINRLKLAKEKRINLSGLHHHQQCEQLPDVIEKTNHRIHLECYKR